MFKPALFLAAVLVPALALGYGAYYGDHSKKKKAAAASKADASVDKSTVAVIGYSSQSLQPTIRPGAGFTTTSGGAAQTTGGLILNTTGQVSGKAVTDSSCPAGSSSVPGLNGTTRCVPGGSR